MSRPHAVFRRLGPGDGLLLRQLNDVFAEASGDHETYRGAPSTEAYLEGLLAKEHIIAVVAEAEGKVLGGLVAYEFDKAERMRREVYIYDLAVAAEHRRQHLATGMIELLRNIAVQRKAWVIFVQADHGDDPAIALYEKLGAREEVLHFDIEAKLSAS
ncbi:AAC(3)-I family aminoglycoside N-acetyltransferase [Belnapia sp. T18]|uniref:AAC(3)-I family aminoglycoside N-acetyltransferase n=1 Tax=Belnapia arida TaxID=2804533 RepID=A0ABS1UA25_9PROT|nr:AAC(3)-I family aminoglycoside N-acetyltransferase [Belnapia arida]MBL6081533.1 AAC(3)-I family aminoglycoside N-acetyltransferase [Belnapia arida]